MLDYTAYITFDQEKRDLYHSLTINAYHQLDRYPEKTKDVLKIILDYGKAGYLPAYFLLIDYYITPDKKHVTRAHDVCNYDLTNKNNKIALDILLDFPINSHTIDIFNMCGTTTKNCVLQFLFFCIVTKRYPNLNKEISYEKITYGKISSLLDCKLSLKNFLSFKKYCSSIHSAFSVNYSKLLNVVDNVPIINVNHTCEEKITEDEFTDFVSGEQHVEPENLINL